MPASTGTDSLTIDLSAGDPIPAGGTSFDGGTGADTLTVVGSASADNFSLSGTTLTANGKTITYAGGTTAINIVGGLGNDVLTIAAATAAAALRFDGGLAATDQDQLTINAGTYKLSADPSLASAHLTIVNNAGVDLNGISATIAALAGNGTVTNTSATSATLSVAGGSSLPGVSNGAGTFSGVISDGTGGVALTKTGTGTLTLTGTNTYSGSTSVTGGTLDTSGGSIVSSTAPMNVSGDGSTLIARKITTSTLTIGLGSVLKLTHVDTVSNLTDRSTAGAMRNAGLIDVGGTGLIVGPLNGTGGGLTDPIIQAQIISGRSGGTWLGGTGITSSIAAGNAAHRSIGYKRVSGQWIIAQTVLGDANLDGTVDISDLGVLSQNYGSSDKTWSQCDYNYDGTVDISDLGTLAQNYAFSIG